MDLKRKGYYARVKATGVGEPKFFDGTILGILGQVVKALATLSLRPNAAGFKEISIIIRSQEISEEPELDTVESLAAEVESLLDD